MVMLIRRTVKKSRRFYGKIPGPGCSKLTTSLVNELLKIQTLISQIRQYFLLKKCEKLLLLSFFQRKISVYLVIKSQKT